MANYRDRPAQTDQGLLVDLSQFKAALENYDDISPLLTDEQERKLVDYAKAMLDMSHASISKRYSHWKQADRAHDVYVPPEATEFREKAVIADTRAISDTVLTYMMAALTGRNPVFQLEGLNRKSRQASAIMERVLHQQMRRTAAEARVAQLCLDSIRYGYAPTKVVWNKKTNSNELINVDPRRSFHDPRVNWGDWERMQFICFADFASYHALIQTGLYPKLKQFPQLGESPTSFGWSAHQWTREEGRGLSIDPNTEWSKESDSYFNLGNAHVTDECWFRVAGYQIGIPDWDEVWLVMTVYDEEAVIRFQFNPYGRQFPVTIGGLFNDVHKSHAQSLYDLLLPLHDIATWLLRSRVDNVQASLNNLIFADPTMVNINDLIDRNPWGVVQTMPGAKPGEGFFVAQVPDITRGHWNDIAALSDMKQRLAAASDAQQGMPTADGIRTATEIQRLTQLGSQRLGVISRVLSATTVRPMVRMMVSNIQDAMAYEGSIRLDQSNMPSNLAGMTQEGYLDYGVKDLQGNIDYLVVDGTLPIEPTRSPETWMNMLQVLNQTGMMMEFDMPRIVEEAIRSMGVPDLDQFRITQEKQAQGPSPSQQLAMLEKMRGASVQSEDQVQSEVKKGNLIPLSQARKQQ